MSLQPLYGVYGAAGCGRGVMPLVRAELALRSAAKDRLVFVDDGEGAKSINDTPVLSYSEFLDVPAASRHVVVAIADGVVRRRIAERLERDGVLPFEARADNVVVMDDVRLGIGAVLSPFVTLTSNIVIGRHFHANLYSYVEHDCVIGDYVTFGPGVHCNGNVVVEDLAYVGAGAIIKQGRPGSPLRIGHGAVVGMGAIVTRDVAPGVTVVGNPARPLVKTVPKHALC